jgi:hypothetical protein
VQLNQLEMKKQLVYIIILIFIISCGSKNNRTVDNSPVLIFNDSISDKLEVINDFLDKKINNRFNKIIILNKKINTDIILQILRFNDIYSLDSVTGKYKQDKTFYKNEEWEKARKKYSKNTISEIEDATYIGSECFWVSENFINKNIIIEEVEFGAKAYEIKYFYRTDYYDFFNFSNPIYYQNKEYLIFYCSYGSVFPPQYYNSAIIIYKKKNGKWEQTHEGAPASFS